MFDDAISFPARSRPRVRGDDIGRAVREHEPPRVEDGVPELGGPLQADPQEVARAPVRAEGAVPAARARQPQRHPHEEGAAGTCRPASVLTLLTVCALCVLRVPRFPLTNYCRVSRVVPAAL